MAVLRMEGTNNEQDMFRAFQAAGAEPSYVHLNQLTPGRVPSRLAVDLEDFDILAIPGGFSAGDYVRAGAIFAARLKTACSDALDHFHEERKPIIGTCNGFQVLVELGLLPGVEAPRTPTPEAVLTTNESDRYECRPSLLTVDEGCVSPFLSNYANAETLMFPSAHAEGRFLTHPGLDVDALADAGQVAFRYAAPDGRTPGYPWNPNGSPGDVAGITDPTGTVLGLMPHPDRVIHGWQHPDWTRNGDPDAQGDGLAFFQGIVEYARKPNGQGSS